MIGYSQSILAALRKRGFADEAILKAISASARRLDALTTGRFELTDREVGHLEELADRSGGQLAYEGSEMNDPAAKKVFDAWNKFRKVLVKERESRSARPAKARKRA